MESKEGIISPLCVLILRQNPRDAPEPAPKKKDKSTIRMVADAFEWKIPSESTVSHYGSPPALFYPVLTVYCEGKKGDRHAWQGTYTPGLFALASRFPMLYTIATMDTKKPPCLSLS
jgi:hypothetical protein